MCLSCFVNRFEFIFLDLSIFLIADCRAISMGQGQEIHARKLVGQFMQTVSIRCIVFPCIEVQCLLFLFAFLFFLLFLLLKTFLPVFMSFHCVDIFPLICYSGHLFPLTTKSRTVVQVLL